TRIRRRRETSIDTNCAGEMRWWQSVGGKATTGKLSIAATKLRPREEIENKVLPPHRPLSTNPAPLSDLTESPICRLNESFKKTYGWVAKSSLVVFADRNRGFAYIVLVQLQPTEKNLLCGHRFGVFQRQTG